MKAHVATILLAAASIALAEPPTGGGLGIQHLPENLKAPVGPPVSDKDLKARQQREKFGGFAAEGAGPKGWDLEKNSEFIVFDGNVTLVPKGAVIHVPERYKANVVTRMQGNFMLWNEFVARYRGLVTGFEVSLAEASGEVAIKPERLEAGQKSGLILVGTLHHNPISVHKAVANVATR